jgi:hypothetical protein
MDELEFRRRIMSDPKALDAEMVAMINEEESRSELLDDVLNLDARIEQAMRVDVPEDLADKILFKQSNNVVDASFGRQFLALAASVAFAFGLIIGQINWSNVVVSPAYASLAETAMHHVIEERPFTSKLDEEVSQRQVNAKLSPFAYQFTQPFPYHITYLNHCGFGESNAMHMVFKGEHGLVTLFITNIESSADSTFKDNNHNGLITSLGSSSLIVVGDVDEDLGKISDNLLPIIQEI